MLLHLLIGVAFIAQSVGEKTRLENIYTHFSCWRRKLCFLWFGMIVKNNEMVSKHFPLKPPKQKKEISLIIN
uniref:Secreted protein n=1 Tax=Pristhesancus plagipennis TaxID=1955184 RepID=A0A2K8JMR6_PRIPG|nr:secreted hypothetical protein [Pristhesancus plagipennis]